MFGSKDVCILKMTIDINGSMNAPFLIPYMYMYIMCVKSHVCVYTFESKQICTKGKKGQRHLILKRDRQVYD